MSKIIISEEEMMKYPGEDRQETYFPIKAVIEGKRCDSILYLDEAYIFYDTSSGKKCVSIKVVIDWLKKEDDKRRVQKKTTKFNLQKKIKP